MSDRTLLVGYDLGDKKTRIAVYDRDTGEPVYPGEDTFGDTEGAMDTRIEMEDGTVLDDFLPKIRRREELYAGGRRTTAVNVLAYYFRKTLALTRKRYPSEMICRLVVTVSGLSSEFASTIYEALERLNIGKDRASVISRRQSFLYFSLYQKKELWVNDVGMFDYSGENLCYYRMQIDRRRSPALVQVQETDYGRVVPSGLSDEKERCAVLEDVVMGAVRRQVLSSLYMTGDGFSGDWADPVFTRLCVGRHVFKGNTLYVDGACYAAKEISEPGRLKDFLLLDEDMIPCSISLRVYADAEEQEVFFAKAGTAWYQADTGMELIPDGDSELVFLVTDAFSGEKKEFMVELLPVEGKTNRLCRLSVRVRFADAHTAIVTVKDEGFGDIFPTSNRIWEQTVRLDGGKKC